MALWLLANLSIVRGRGQEQSFMVSIAFQLPLGIFDNEYRNYWLFKRNFWETMTEHGKEQNIQITKGKNPMKLIYCKGILVN